MGLDHIITDDVITAEGTTGKFRARGYVEDGGPDEGDADMSGAVQVLLNHKPERYTFRGKPLIRP